MKIWRICVACRVPKSTNKKLEYVILLLNCCTNDPRYHITITLYVFFISTAMKVDEKFYCPIKRSFIFLDKFVHVLNLSSKYQFTGEMRIYLLLSDFDQHWNVPTTAMNIFTADLR